MKKAYLVVAVALAVLGLTPDRSEAGFLKRVRDRRCSACASAPVAPAVRGTVAGGTYVNGVCSVK